jgi:hypothetical protein
MIGCGKRAMQNVIALKAGERCEIACLADIKKESAEKIYTDYKRNFHVSMGQKYINYCGIRQEVL